MFVDNNCKAFHIFLAFTVKQICSPDFKCARGIPIN